MSGDLPSVIGRYLEALESGAGAEQLRHFFAEGAEQTEFPNLLNPTGNVSDLTTLLARAERGVEVLVEQRYEVRSAFGAADRWAVEIGWTGTLKIPVAQLAAGDQMRAHLAVFFELRDDRIWRQRNYDCFEPFAK